MIPDIVPMRAAKYPPHTSSCVQPKFFLSSCTCFLALDGSA